MERCAALSERLDLFQVLLDHPHALDQLKKRPLKDGRLWHVWLKLDCGNGRGKRAKHEDSSSAAVSLVMVDLRLVLCRSRCPALRTRGAEIGSGHRRGGGRGAHGSVRSLWEHLQLQRSGANTGCRKGNHRFDLAVYEKVCKKNEGHGTSKEMQVEDKLDHITPAKQND